MSSQPVSGAAQLHLLFDQMADAVYLLDPDTSNIVWGNRKAWESLGLSAEEVLNHSVLSLQKDVHGMPQWSEIAAAIRATECNSAFHCRTAECEVMASSAGHCDAFDDE